MQFTYKLNFVFAWASTCWYMIPGSDSDTYNEEHFIWYKVVNGIQQSIMLSVAKFYPVTATKITQLTGSDFICLIKKWQNSTTSVKFVNWSVKSNALTDGDV